jgi:HEAT repeat protein
MRQLVPRRRQAGRAAASGGSAALREYERARRALAAEVAQLETEIERLHALITSNAVPVRREGGALPSLKELLDQSRHKRDLCHEKRQELLRIERHIQRERRLSPLEPPEMKQRGGESVPGSRTAARRAEAHRTAKATRARAVARAADKASFANEAERLAFQRLADRLLDDDPDVRRDAVARLSGFGRPDVPELLISAADDPNDHVRVAALNALVGSNYGAAADAFRRYLHDENPALRLSALRGLASLEVRFLPNAALVARLEDRDAAVRRTAANILGWRRDPELAPDVVHALALSLHDDDDDVRAAAAEALGNLADHRGVLSLIGALADSVAEVADAADRALRAILGSEAARIGEGKSTAERIVLLKEWWKDARAEAYLAAHAGELPTGGSEAQLPPPVPRPAPRVAPVEPAAAAAEARKPAKKSRSSRPAPASSRGTQRKAAAAEPKPDVGVRAAESSVADAFSEIGAETEEGAEIGDEGGEDFESMFGGEEAAAEEAPAESEKPARRAAAKGKAAKPKPAEVEEEEESEEGEEGGGFEDLFGGGGEET